jgi:hypothetical protein
MRLSTFVRFTLAAVLVSGLVAGCAGQSSSKDSGSSSPVKQSRPGSGTKQAEPGSGSR